MALAIFDLDNTLLAGDSDHAWGEFMIAEGWVDEAYFKRKNDEFYQQYQAGTLDIHAYQRFSLEPLVKRDIQTLKNARAKFVEEIIKPMIAEGTQDLLYRHRQQNDTLLIITATNTFVTEPIAKILDIPHLIGTEPEYTQGQFTGNIVGTPSFQHGKVERLQSWLKDQSHSLAGSYFYSDSHNDIPLLNLVDHPIAVDPCPTLKEKAEEKKWRIISLR